MQGDLRESDGQPYRGLLVGTDVDTQIGCALVQLLREYIAVLPSFEENIFWELGQIEELWNGADEDECLGCVDVLGTTDRARMCGLAANLGVHVELMEDVASGRMGSLLHWMCSSGQWHFTPWLFGFGGMLAFARL